MNSREAVLRALELGTSTSPEAPAELRECIAVIGPGRQEVRCAAVAALACTVGADATIDLAVLLADRTRAVREIASDLLFNVGDDRAWDIVLNFFTQEVQQRGPKRGPMPPAMPVSYLVIHSPAGSERAIRLITFLRGEWKRLSAYERQWLVERVPGVVDGSLTPRTAGLPDRERLGVPVA